jgi:hypothetical protein
MGLNLNIFASIIGTSVVGLFFGYPAGSAIGAALGILRSRRLGKIADFEYETEDIVKRVVIPASFVLVTLPIYLFWLGPILIEWSHYNAINNASR